MEELVIDSSVIAKWYAVPREPGFDRAKALLVNHTHNQCRLHIPMLALYELGNLLLQFGHRLSTQERLGHLADLFELGLSIHPLNLPNTLVTFELAQAFRVSFYDASFVALAQTLDVPLITADERLCRQLGSLSFVRPLASYPND